MALVKEIHELNEQNLGQNNGTYKFISFFIIGDFGSKQGLFIEDVFRLSSCEHAYDQKSILIPKN